MKGLRTLKPVSFVSILIPVADISTFFLRALVNSGDG